MRHLLLTAGLIGAAPAMAGEPRIALPAGPLGQAVAVLGRQHGVSIAVDPALWSRPVPSIAGRLSTRAALDRLAQAAAGLARGAGAAGKIGGRHGGGGADPAPDGAGNGILREGNA